ncbi:MAG TPA: hypothetical protein VKO85_03520 [Wenzhouxiangellaceae bacterium]|nr:hypothetical protein [Wenzhouxiangellaceae bacterium]
MSRTQAIFLVCVITVVVAALAYTTLHVPERPPTADGQAEAEQQGNATGRTGVLLQPAGEKSAGDERPLATALAEAVRPNIVTYKHGQPLWDLSYPELHEHVNDLRALAGAGWGQAVFPLARLLSGCLRNPNPRGEHEIRAQARAQRERIRGNDADLPRDEVDRRLANVDSSVELQLQHSSRRRAACAAVTPADEDRMMDWLELALEQHHPAFLAGYLRWDLLPDDDAWMVRYAERLAQFNRRFEVAYLDGVYAGEREMLDLAWKLYATHKVLPEPDPFMAFAFNHAADLEARATPEMTRQYMDSFRLDTIDLDAAQAELARAEGERIYDRCCADARMPR